LATYPGSGTYPGSALYPSATLPQTAALTGAGTLTGSGVAFVPGTAALSGAGTLTGTGQASGQGTALLSGTGTLSGTGAVTYQITAALSGAGTLTGVGLAVLVQPPAALSGTGTLTVTGITLGLPPVPLTGSGTLAIAGQSGGLVYATPGASIPLAYPGTSQVWTAPPGSTAWQPLGQLGAMTALTYSFTMPGGCDTMSCTLMIPATYRTTLFNPGWQVRITRGGHQVWDGKLDEPVPTSSGWNLTAIGTGNLGQDYLALYSDPWPENQPDESIDNAVSRGLPWANAGIGQPAGAWYGQGADEGSQTITDLLNLICTRGGLTWYVNSQPGGVPGDDITVFPLPSVPDRLLVCTNPVPRTLGGDINTIWLRYQITADATGTDATSATYGLALAQDATSVALHGTMETYIDISDAGVMTYSAAFNVGWQVLQIYQRASYAGPFTARYGQLLTTGGTPIDPGAEQAGHVVKLILTDFGYGGELTSATPVEFLVGSYEWDDFAQTATLTPFQNINQSLTGLLSLENTLLTPITVASS
jgi:hypothetical protein